MHWSIITLFKLSSKQIEFILLYTIIFVWELILAERHYKFGKNYGTISLNNNTFMNGEVNKNPLNDNIVDTNGELKITNTNHFFRKKFKGELRRGLFYVQNSNSSNQEEIAGNTFIDGKIFNTIKESNNTQLCWPYFIFKRRVLLKEVCQSKLTRNSKSVDGEIIKPGNTRGGGGVFTMRELNPRKFARFLNLFTIVNFPNELCVDGDETFGTCYHQSECERLGGSVKGTCANGYGVCCYIQNTCGQRTNANGTYFVAGNFLDTSEHDVSACSLTIEKSDASVKQIRVDFIYFKVSDPINGNCGIDKFVVTGQNRNNIVPEICGVNTGQHIYLDVDMSEGPVMIAILSSKMRGVPKNFVIKVLQLRDGDALLAPNSCLQYHVSNTGTISSFNYQPNATDLSNGYMNNLNYAVCIKKEYGFCSITYSNLINKIDMPFELKNLDEDGMFTVNPGEAGVESYNCPDDYIVLNKVKLCGYRLNDASENPDFRSNHLIRDTDNGPFVVSVRTNSNITGKGFSLQYKQIPC
ncbi:uncharacterized protein LOC111047104 [Nilaparvata lugens]|uniref:uncharacterized protein LOC111047104 n=1 Tax=Nilaparvata lugens TaxID=108931 RepID=UPI00193CA7DE|nr:uncharacterized protein LOC111047104 [Nilaparvata lugens]